MQDNEVAPMRSYTIAQRLEELGIELPPPKEPVANYLGCKKVGRVLYVAGQIGDIKGAVGADVDKAGGRLCARQACLYMLGTVQGALGSLEPVASVDKLLGFVRSAPDFIEQPYIIDAASDLLIKIFGDDGRHSRTATGVLQTPFGAAVQLEMTLGLNEY
jgi:enamine deaminase RidA (YjgF/YER057c/UK114 family)